MFTVTNAALDRLSHRLARKEATDGIALRFTRREGGWTLRFDRESAGDIAFAHDGRNVLLLDETVSTAMTNMTLDARKSGQRSRLRLYHNERPTD